MARVALLVSSGGVKAPRSASIAGASGIHHGKQLVPVLRQPVPRVLRQPVPRALRQQAPRGDYDRAFIGAASSVGSSVKARATTAFRTSAVEEDE